MTRPIPHFDIVDDATAAKLRLMTPAQKVQLVGELNKAARLRAAQRLNCRHPEWSNEQVQAEIAKRMLAGDEELFA